ncbi:Cysteine--tRNA ligase, cytoplasmic [Thelohanellus kitauei]|uniref:Cysteine--tRNA ligase, cytoplasmic n=1 Tax=Thelohanellus kitauei TaxID=669202 RepID=A0A0C2NH02_THEKT|nr:Cysteine--tRNA ligase, cytoplasmic [Thelohanellus kitauei]
MNEACALDKRIADFLNRVNSFLSDESSLANSFSMAEQELKNTYVSTHEEVHSAICGLALIYLDNIDTPKAMNLIKTLISSTYSYIASRNNENLHKYLLTSISEYLIRILGIFGAIYGDSVKSNSDKLAFDIAQESAKFRSKIRILGIDIKNHELLSLCDEFRDVNMFNLGVKIEDREKSSTVIISTKEELEKERETNRLLAEKQKLLKEEKMRKREEDAEKKLREMVPPNELFLKETDKYSKFDEHGFPILDAEGNPISKSALKKIKKILERHTALYEKHCPGKCD